MSLNKLPPATVKLINSAQVITSVSSVVKELIENSLDAGATNIEVKLENHGLKKIEVVDNGRGIAPADVWNMCKKSYTSKITSFDDLGKLGTYGFRGEALNSLCAVSKVSITTITDNDNVAMMYDFDTNGNVVGSKMSHINKGTIVTIENLFNNLPVRRQFLTNGKRKADEIKKVELTVKMLAVIQPRVRLVLSHNKFCIWQKNSSPNIRLSLIQAVAPTLVKQLVDLRHTIDEMKLQLLIPEKGCNISTMCYKNTGEAVFLFINHRPVRDRNIEKIVENEIFNYFGHEIPSGKHPMCLVSIVLPPECLDVNLEPNKTRVILRDMNRVGAILKEKLVEYYIGSLEAPTDFLDAIDIEVSKSGEKRKNTEEIIEVKVKIPKIKQENPKTQIILNSKLAEEMNLSSKKSGTINDNSSTSIPDSSKIPSLNSSRDKIVAEFIDGLEKKSFVTNEVELKEHIAEKDVNKEDSQTTCGDYFPNADSKDSLKISNEEFSFNSTTDEPKPKEEACTSVDIDSITLSQWSRGNFKINGETIQSSTTILGSKDMHHKNESVSIVNIDPLSSEERKVDLNETQASERSVSSQMGCKDMAGFTRYANEMSKKITQESKGISFTKVASELANNWRKLQDSEKEMYNEKAKNKPKPSKERENKANASMRDQLQRFLAKCNERKPLKRRKYPRIVSAGVTLSSVRKALERRVDKSKECELRYLGSLSDDIKFAVNENRELIAFSERRLAESLLLYNNLATMIVPYKVLEKNILVNQEILGDSLWSEIVSLETAIDSRSGVVIIADQRITSNGLRMELAKDPSGSCCFQITDVPLHVAFFGIEDVKEILTLIEKSPVELPLEGCRPLKIISYIRAETIRHISKNDFNPDGGNPHEKLKFWMTTIMPKIGRCPHHNCVFKKLDIPD